jgi:hypothetical protein
MTVLASSDAGPAVVSQSRGRGRVIVSGALDAWRYRDVEDGFARYWRSLVAAAVAAAGPELRVNMARRLLRPGEEAPFTVEWQTMSAVPSEVTALAQLYCGDRPPRFVRLWPGARPGMFDGTVSPDVSGRCRLAVELLEPTRIEQTADLVVAEDARVRPASGDFDGTVRAMGGIVADENEWRSLIERLPEQLPVSHEPGRTNPMRSPWWFVPFALCLCGEWWLRRRGGLR